MNENIFLRLAAEGHRMPIGTHLVLHQQPDSKTVADDGARLGEVIAATANRFDTPLAVPLMDLTLEKAALLHACGVPAETIESFHFHAPGAVPQRIPLTPRQTAACAAIASVARRPGLLPMGMSIGPFSLTTKLLSDPITPVFLAGTGATAADDPEVALLDHVAALAERTVHAYLEAQITAGARAIIICEPAANIVYFSPNQIAQDPAAFERYAMQPMQRVAALLAAHGVDLVFHDCGELSAYMVGRFATLGSAMVSLGSSRRLWEDAPLFPMSTVLYGNLPTKRFVSPQLTVEEVERTATGLLTRMRAAGHPFILGSECDVLSVPGSEDAIAAKVDALMRADRS
jgi:uroporphyrinogen-III decarboxylase